MCGGGGGVKPVQQDPVADAEKAAAEAAAGANAQASLRRRSRRASALMVSRPAQLGGDTSSAISYGKTVLGG